MGKEAVRGAILREVKIRKEEGIWKLSNLYVYKDAHVAECGVKN